jgi:hypothetical protein
MDDTCILIELLIVVSNDHKKWCLSFPYIEYCLFRNALVLQKPSWQTEPYMELDIMNKFQNREIPIDVKFSGNYNC